MNSHRAHDAPGSTSPRAARRLLAAGERERLERGATVIEAWLDVQNPDEDSVLDVDAEALWTLNALALDGAPEPELIQAVRVARTFGWAWGPIAMAVGETPQRTRARFDTTSTVRAAQVPTPRTSWPQDPRTPRPESSDESRATHGLTRL